MECHKCPFREKIDAGEFAQAAFSETPCAKCQLNENSDLTMEFHVEMENRRAQDSGLEDMDVMLPISVMKEIVFMLLSMTPENRDVLCWRFGIPYRDIAVLQGVTVAAVEKRHWKVMKKWPALRAMFAAKVAKHTRRKSVGSGPMTVDRKENSGSRMKHKGRQMNREERNG